MNNNINVDVRELSDIKRKIEFNSTELISILKQIIYNTELTKDCFDSLTGAEFRREMIDYLNGRINFIQNNYLSFSNKLTSIINDYNEFYKSVSDMVGEDNGLH